MGVKKIDTIQSAQIATLEADIVELKNKLNLLVADIQNITSNANQIITDLNDLNGIIMDGYTAPSSPTSDGILERMDNYKDAFTDHINYPWWVSGVIYMSVTTVTHDAKVVGGGGGGAFAPGAGGGAGGSSGGTSGSGWSYGSPVLGGTGQGSNSSHTQGSSDASVDGNYKDKERMLGITTASAKRAKKLARQTLNRLRK